MEGLAEVVERVGVVGLGRVELGEQFEPRRRREPVERHEGQERRPALTPDRLERIRGPRRAHVHLVVVGAKGPHVGRVAAPEQAREQERVRADRERALGRDIRNLADDVGPRLGEAEDQDPLAGVGLGVAVLVGVVDGAVEALDLGNRLVGRLKGPGAQRDGADGVLDPLALGGRDRDDPLLTLLANVLDLGLELDVLAEAKVST